MFSLSLSRVLRISIIYYITFDSNFNPPPLSSLAHFQPWLQTPTPPPPPTGPWRGRYHLNNRPSSYNNSSISSSISISTTTTSNTPSSSSRASRRYPRSWQSAGCPCPPHAWPSPPRTCPWAPRTCPWAPRAPGASPPGVSPRG